jgi:long-chain acyl-CoA synthetase
MAIDWLLERMREFGDAPAVVYRDRTATFSELLARTAAWQHELDRLGVEQGDVVAMHGDYAGGPVALLLALIARGTIAVPLTESVAPKRPELLALAEARHLFVFEDGDRWRHEALEVTATHPMLRQLAGTGKAGLILFTSGSTGPTKAALHDFERVLEKFQVRRPTRITMTFLLLDHVGGINTLFAALSCGGTVVAPQTRDPDEVCALIARHAVELLPASPTFLGLLLLSEAYTRHDLTSLALITYGTEPMPESTLRRLHAAFPDAKLQQTYGLSELGILRSKSRDNESLWVRVGGEGFDLKVVDGVLWIRSRYAMLGYLNAPSPFDADGWMNTGDAVDVDGEFIRIKGRKSEIINVGGHKVSPSDVESVLLEVPNINDAVVFAAPNPIMGQVVAARVNLAEPEEPDALRRRLRAALHGRLARHEIPVVVEIAEQTLHGARFKKRRTGEP